MYSIVEIQGHQYRVKPGDIIDVQKINQEEGSSVDLSSVLFLGGDTPLIGKPVIEGAFVKAKIVRHGRSRKILMMKRSPGKYQKRRGHRQNYTCLEITEIGDGKGNSLKA